MNVNAGAFLTKGMRVKAHFFQANDPPSSLAGMQMKLGVTERLIEGVVVKISSTSRTALVDVKVHIKPDQGEEVLVDPDHIVEILKSTQPEYAQASTEQREVRNTTREVHENPLEGLIGFLGDAHRGRPAGSHIEDMEARGQRELVSQTAQLPSEGSNDAAWKEMGVLFGAELPGDKLFRAVKLPVGWKLKATTHNMWSELLDEKGRVRGKMFYKAAHYDRRANIYPERRYQLKSEYKDEDVLDGDHRVNVRDAATNAVLFTGDWVSKSQDKKVDPYVQPTEWLTKNRPDWNNAAAYWGWD